MTEQPSNTPFSDLIREIGLKKKRQANERLAELGMNAQQGQMIGYIAENQENGLIQKDLAEHFNRKEASITSMLQGLERKGYIQRVIPKENERQKKIYLLEKAAVLVEEFNEIFAEVEKSITENLTAEEAETLMRLLSKVNSSL
ncbi:MarR family transcriptional regulator [Paenibacillus helianthi]|uniref:MarR family transcriptional regulator n=1 Tax=Paenibacillus helianthi TaxID=1349432 RepID=A0ABX3EGN8_9BACL|nr:MULTISPECIES: MarR family transcriptional regulator [Paenibacillus]OKP77584.1 MarR family transcriptional regulator [Paenibacillus helianthi]OKP78525.1 MarR family transcriptional regulator [Paenibacillus sp. P3E]OKP92348.1 MarR family transcriptional regulator [Paenibacillus sp. P32E]